VKEQHGMTKTSMFSRWQSMLQRCCNPNHRHYGRYGGRGITVCREWRESFAAFYSDMGDPPTPTHQIDRADNSLGYSKDNCRWALPADNSRNRSTTKLTSEDVAEIIKLAAGGVSNGEIALRFGIKPHTVSTMTWRANRTNRGDKKGHRDASSRYRGVSWQKQTRRWQVRVQSDYIGLFSSEADAARAYDAEAARRFGDRATLNFPADRQGAAS